MHTISKHGSLFLFLGSASALHKANRHWGWVRNCRWIQRMPKAQGKKSSSIPDSVLHLRGLYRHWSGLLWFLHDWAAKQQQHNYACVGILSLSFCYLSVMFGQVFLLSPCSLLNYPCGPLSLSCILYVGIISAQMDGPIWMGVWQSIGRGLN